MLSCWPFGGTCLGAVAGYAASIVACASAPNDAPPMLPLLIGRPMDARACFSSVYRFATSAAPRRGSCAAIRPKAAGVAPNMAVPARISSSSLGWNGAIACTAVVAATTALAFALTAAAATLAPLPPLPLLPLPLLPLLPLPLLPLKVGVGVGTERERPPASDFPEEGKSPFLNCS